MNVLVEDRFPSKYSGPEQSPGYLLWRVTCRWQQKQRAALSKLGLTHPQFVLLAATYWLAQSEEAVQQVMVAKQAGTDPMTTSQVLRTLEKKGWIERQPHPTDSRAKVLSVTEEGAQLIKRAMPVVEEVDRAFFQLAPEEERQLVDQLRSLI